LSESHAPGSPKELAAADKGAAPGKKGSEAPFDRGTRIMMELERAKPAWEKAGVNLEAPANDNGQNLNKRIQPGSPEAKALEAARDKILADKAAAEGAKAPRLELPLAASKVAVEPSRITGKEPASSLPSDGGKGS